VASLEEVGLVHRDISLGNMVLESDAGPARDEDCTGRLTDMDLIAPLQTVIHTGEFDDDDQDSSDEEIVDEKVRYQFNYQDSL